MTEEQALSEAMAEEREVNRGAAPYFCVRAEDYLQWQVGPNGTYYGGFPTERTLPKGAYAVHWDQSRQVIFLKRHEQPHDTLYSLPDMRTLEVMSRLRKFWESGHVYRNLGLTHKRGVLLWGPPGSGKTATIMMLIEETLQLGGVVLIATVPDHAASALHLVRQIEPDRPMVMVLEDLDETIAKYGEVKLLSMLDGEDQVSNVVFLGTTNYPGKLGARIINRPGRFDERIFVDLPSLECRRAYIEKISWMKGVDVARWAKDTNGLSFGHIRELVTSVMILKQPYEQAIERLRKMSLKLRDVDGFRSELGFK